MTFIYRKGKFRAFDGETEIDSDEDIGELIGRHLADDDEPIVPVTSVIDTLCQDFLGDELLWQ